MPLHLVALQEQFVDSDQDDHAVTFGAIYWQFGMSGLSDDAKEQAARVLARLGGRS